MTLFSKFTKSGGSDKNVYPWSQRKLSGSNNALPRFGHSATMVDNQHFLVYGGIHRGNTKKNLFIIDTNAITANSLSTSGDIPSLRSFATINSFGPFILLYGGEPIHASEIWDPHFYVLHTNTRQWSRVRTKGILPQERTGHSTCVSEDGIMYIWGGHFQRKYLNDLCAFNVKDYPLKAEWDFIKYENQGPTPRSGHVSVIHDKKLYIFGGINASHLYNDIWSFDLVNHTWYQISAVGYIPAPRESCAAALVDDTIYIFGGRGLNGCGLGDLCAFRIKSQRWYMFQSMGAPPSPRYGLTMTVIQNKIYVFGGDSVSGRTEDSAHVYTLDCSKIKYPPEPEASESENSKPHRAKVNNTSNHLPQEQVDADTGADLKFPPTPQPTHRQQLSISDEEQKINSPISAYSMESNSSHFRQSPHTDLHSPPPPRPPREGAVLGDAYRQSNNTNPVIIEPAFKFKRESSLPSRSHIPADRHASPPVPPISGLNKEEKNELMREIQARDAIIAEMRKKEQWWRTEVSIARHMRHEQGEQFDDESDAREALLLQFDDQEQDKMMLFQQLVAAKTEIKKIRSSMNKQSEPIIEKIEQVEHIKTIALEEAAYYKAKYVALKSRDSDALKLLESERIDVLEKRLLQSYEERDIIDRTLQKVRTQSKHDQTARMLAEERAKDAQLQSEKAQEAHQKVLEELTQLYEQLIKAEAQGRDDAIKIADLSHKLANQISAQNNNDHLHMELGRLEAANIKSRNEIATLLKKLEESKDDENHLKMLLNEKDQAYAEAVLELEKTCIELELVKNMSSNGSQQKMAAVQ